MLERILKIIKAATKSCNAKKEQASKMQLMLEDMRSLTRLEGTLLHENAMYKRSLSVAQQFMVAPKKAEAIDKIKAMVAELNDGCIGCIQSLRAITMKRELTLEDRKIQKETKKLILKYLADIRKQTLALNEVVRIGVTAKYLTQARKKAEEIS